MSAAVVAGMAVAMLVGASSSQAPATTGEVPPKPVDRCQVEEAGLTELSGLASDGEVWYAIGDGGSSLRVYELDPDDCSVLDVHTAAVNPYDVEDLALASDGGLWLADTGDNARRRDTVALHEMRPDGAAALYRLTYPDGPHDAEALLLDRDGVPFIVTKEPFGLAGIYRPDAPLSPGTTTPLRQVGSLSLRTTDTPGGPISGNLGSILVTGGSVSRDGTRIALRTYTDAYLFSAPDGDVPAALGGTPVRLPLPGEPQGEAIAWQPDGTLLSASEDLYPIRAVAGAAGLLDGAHASRTRHPETITQHQDRGGPDKAEDNRSSAVPMMIVAGACAALIMYGGRVLRRRAR